MNLSIQKYDENVTGNRYVGLIVVSRIAIVLGGVFLGLAALAGIWIILVAIQEEPFAELPAVTSVITLLAIGLGVLAYGQIIQLLVDVADDTQATKYLIKRLVYDRQQPASAPRRPPPIQSSGVSYHSPPELRSEPPPPKS